MNLLNWADLSAFVDMGGYGLYVWGSFGMAAGVMLIEMLSLRARRLALHASFHAASEQFDEPTEASFDARDFARVRHEG